MTKSPLLFLMILLLVGTGTAAAQDPSPIRTVTEIRHLPRGRQKEKPAVDLECVLIRLMNGSPLNLLVWQDGTAIYVNAAEAAANGVNVELWRSLRPGDRIRLRGRVQEGHFAPTVYPLSVEFLDHGTLPAPRPVVASELSSGVLDAQWVSITGVVQSLQRSSPKKYYWTYELGSPQGPFTAIIDQAGTKSFVGSQVSMRGICLPYFNYRGQMLGLMLSLRSVEDIEVLRPAEEDPFKAPVTSDSLMRDFDPDQGIHSGRRVLQGVVTSIQPGSHLILQSSDGHGVKVQLAAGQSAAVGDFVEASGFVILNDAVAELKNALVRTTGTAPLPEPLPLTSAALSGNVLLVPGTKKAAGPRLADFNQRLVTLTGTLLQAVRTPDGEHTLWIQNPETPPLTVPVSVPSDFVPPPPGSVVEVLGMCELGIDPKLLQVSVLFPNTAKVILSRAQDLKVLQYPPWWTPVRLRIAAVIITILSVLTLLLVRRLRRRVRLSGDAMADARQRQKAAETRSEERQRLAEEIHDTMAQNLTGVALQIAAAGMVTPSAPPEVSKHLKLASGLLDLAREEIRRTLFDLRSGQLENGNLTETLDNITRMIIKSRACDVDWEVTGHSPYVHPLAAHSLLRVAQESLDNSLKHGRASRIRIMLHYAETSVRLTISDNGHGCGPGPRPGPMEGHFGIENMRGWVNRLEGEFHFHSLPGSGTVVTATIPVHPHNPTPAPPSPPHSLNS